MKLFWWLLPGLRLKRYVIEIIVGLILLAASGVLFALWLTGDTTEGYGENIASGALFYFILAAIVAVILLYYGITGLSRSIVRILRSGGAKGQFKDLVLSSKRRETGPKIVVFGGGTGMKSLLSGLKKYTGRISAVITMADDGGSSGRLRHEIGTLPPGDIRNCLVALSDAGKTLEEMFQYRSEDNFIDGHSFGNLFIITLFKITGDFRSAVRQAGEVLSIMGEVLPSTTDRVALVAQHEDGSVTTGQSEIQTTESRIEKVELRPTPSSVHEDISSAIRESSMLVFGPGSLFTSIIPNLLVPGMIQEIRKSSAIKVYVCNILTQIGETDDFGVLDHIRALEAHTNGRFFDVVIINNNRTEIPIYRESQQYVEDDLSKISQLGYEVIETDMIGKYHLHDSEKLSKALFDLITRKLSEESSQ